jgi:hypothetical protein
MKSFNKKSKPKHCHPKKKYRKIVDCDYIIINPCVPSGYVMFVDFANCFDYRIGINKGIGVIVNNPTYKKLLELARSKHFIIYNNVARGD